MKIYELAKELGVDNKAIIDFLVKSGVEVKSHMSSISDENADKVRAKFAPKKEVKGVQAVPVNIPASASAKKPEVKAVALPDHIIKKVEEENKASQTASESKSADSQSQAKSDDASADVKKKKKIVAVLNPQYSSSSKGQAYAQKQQQSKGQQSRPQPSQDKKPLPSQVRPARERRPDDYEEQAKRPLPSQVRPARERKPDDYVEPEVKETPVAVVEAVKEEPAQAKKPEVKAEAEVKEIKKAPAAPVKEEVKEEIKKEVKKEAVKEPVKEPVKKDTSLKDATSKIVAKPVILGNLSAQQEAKKQAEAQAAAAAQAQKPQQQKNYGQKPQKNNPQGGRNDRNQNQNRNNQGKQGESQAVKSLREKLVKGTVNPDDLLGKGQQGGKPQGQKNGYNNQNKNGQGGYSKDGQDSSRRPGGKPQGQQGAGRQSASAAPAVDTKGNSGKGKGKGGKDKFVEKSKGDKFDRLENERGATRTSKVVETKPEEEEIKVVTLPETISLKDLASKLKMQPSALIKKLFLQGQIMTLNDILDYEAAEEICLGMDIIAEKEIVIDRVEELLKEEEESEDLMVKRPPVVCVMGHVDHGKTSLLDAIRKTSVTSREAGGITQHIGAYTVMINDQSITFLDTPGHEAFTAMRLRGAQATDVAILVVAADDGVMPQTVEAINHAKAAGIHVIVAVNKIDKPAANIDKVKQELSELGLIPEDWGGNTIFVPVSAKTGQGIGELLEMVILDTEILELRANPNRMARGIVIEAKLDKGRGSVATLLVQKGTLKVGDHVAMGEFYGKVRSLISDKGERIQKAGPSTPVEITGLSGVPNAGDTFVAFDSDKDAKQFAQVFIEENKKKLLAGTKAKMNLNDVFDQMKAGELKELALIIKADVQGSVEAIRESLEKLSNDEVVVRCIHTGVGNVSESDAILASASNAIIIAFNVSVNADARDTIEHEKVDLRKYNVIYNAIDDVEAAIKGMLAPVYEEVILGHVEIRQTFKASQIGMIAGSYVTDGIVKRDSMVRLSRAGELLFDGPIQTLKRFKDDAKEVKSGYECGIVLKGFQDFTEGDVMEVYEMKQVSRS